MLLKQLFFILVVFKFSSAINYKNYILYRGVPVSQEHLKFFEDLPNRFYVNFWREPEVLGKPIEFIISPRDKAQFEDLADRYGIYLTTLAEDIQSLLDQSAPPEEKFKAKLFDWKKYQRIEEIYNWMKSLSLNNSRSVKVFSIGQTAENRPIMVLHLSFPSGYTQQRPKVIIEGGIHAREWISVSFVTYMIDQFLKGANEEVKNIRSAYEYFFIPVLNPDGYAYSHDKDRLWRKNRNYGGLGVDLNRNFDALFGVVGSSQNQTSEKYCGPHSFSENESMAMKNFVEKHSKDLGYYLSFHSYGQDIILPYLYSEAHMGNYDEMKKLGIEAANTLYKRYNTSYTVGTAKETVGYMASGASICWVKKSFHVPVVFLMELRDTGRYGFALPPELIVPTCEETLDGILTILKTKTGLRSKVTAIAAKNISNSKTASARVLNELSNKVPSMSKTVANNKILNTANQTSNKTEKSKKIRARKRRRYHKKELNGQNIVEVNIYLLSVFTFVFNFVVVL